MDIRKAFGTRADLENEGVWIDIGDGARIKVARAGNRAHAEVIRRLRRQYQATRRGGKAADDMLERLSVEAMAEAVLLDWQGVEEGGAAVPYSLESAQRMLTDYKDFRDMVAGFSTDMALFQEEEEAAAAKNS